MPCFYRLCSLSQKAPCQYSRPSGPDPCPSLLRHTNWWCSLVVTGAGGTLGWFLLSFLMFYLTSKDRLDHSETPGWESSTTKQIEIKFFGSFPGGTRLTAAPLGGSVILDEGFAPERKSINTWSPPFRFSQKHCFPLRLPITTRQYSSHRINLSVHHYIFWPRE